LLPLALVKLTSTSLPTVRIEVMRSPPLASLNSLVSPVIRSVAVAVKYWFEKLPLI